MKGSEREIELLQVKIKSLQSQATQAMKGANGVNWLKKYGLNYHLPNVPRYQQFQTLARVALTGQEFYAAIFGQEETIIELLGKCQELYDMAFLVEQHVKVKQIKDVPRNIVDKLFEKFAVIFEGNADLQSIFYLQGINLYISASQSTTKEPPITFAGSSFISQRKQAGKVYEFVFKPLFEKKDLKPYYLKMVGMVGWLVLMDCKVELVADLAKKLSIFVLFNKSNQSWEMISVFSIVFDWLSVHFPRELGLNHANFASLFIKFRSYRLDVFMETWVEQRIGFKDTVNYDFLLRQLAQMGAGGLALEMLVKVWNVMKRGSCFQVLLKIFSGFIRKQFLRLWLQNGDALQRYLRMAKYFMVGLSNLQRFQGQQIDEFTDNLCRHLLVRDINFAGSYRQVVQFYALYQSRFSYLSQKAKKFLTQVKERYQVTIQTGTIHTLFDKYVIREIAQDEEGDQYWQKGKQSFRYRGLQNLGNTCYINSFMQALFMTKKFRNHIQQLTKNDQLPSDMMKTYALKNLFQELTKKDVNKQEPFRPQYFRMELPQPFNASPEQQDSGQFGRIYLDILAKELGKDHSSKLSKLLLQQLTKTFRCSKCGDRKQKPESLFDLILAIDRTENQLFLSKLVQKYFHPELFTGQNKVFCQKCGRKQQAISELRPDKFSQVVVLTLNLFDYVGEGIKILTPLRFEFVLNFDLLLNTKDFGEYQLYAFIIHLGSNLGGGHYICYARNLEQNPMMWYCLDDGYVTEREIQHVDDFNFAVNETPYMLFYSKKAPKNKMQRSNTLQIQ